MRWRGNGRRSQTYLIADSKCLQGAECWVKLLRGFWKGMIPAIQVGEAGHLERQNSVR